MPKVLTFGRYVLFFWMGENNEPIHIHVAVKHPITGATKFWLLSNGGCLLANNDSEIPDKDLRRIAKYVTLNHTLICDRWVEEFGESALKFYE